MHYLLSFPLLFALVAPVVADEPEGDDLFPLAVGNRWIYRIQGQEDRLTISAAASEKIGGVDCVRLEGRLQNRLVATEHLAVRKDGAYRYRHEGIDIEPPLPICKFPLQSGETWRAEYKMHDKKASIAYECETVEVTVPAGKFAAVAVRAEIADGTHKLRNTVWYAPRVGMVKQIIADGDRSIVLLLDRFEKAGDKELKGPPKKGLKQ